MIEDAPRQNTATEILDAAERLFAAKGFDGTSVREITRAAGANVAAVHYHFGSKEAVLRGVTDRVVGPLNSRRFELLDAALAEAGSATPSVEAVLDAFVRADIETLQALQARGPTVAHFLGRTYGDPAPWIQQMAREQFAEAAERFLPVLAASAPDVPSAEIGWRMNHLVAVLVRVFTTWPSDAMSDREAEDTLARLIAFLAPGIRAPVPVAEGVPSTG